MVIIGDKLIRFDANYEDMSEEEQWNNDHSMGDSYKETKENDETYEINSFEEWREYRNDKINSYDLELYFITDA
jgi:hypothetical protein